MPRILVVEHEPDGSLDLMTAVLSEGAGVEVVRPYLGQSFPAVGSIDGLVVLGGSMGALDDDVAPWLPATRTLLGDAVSSALPVLGVCLGAQLLAVATGGRIERGAAGLEIGPVEVSALPAAGGDPFFGAVGRELGERWTALQYHYDAVTRLPPDAELLATGDRYPVQGYRVGASAWGVQYHPEVSTRSFLTWVGTGVQRGELADHRELLEAARGAEASQARTAHVHARALRDLVVTADRRTDPRDTVSR